MCVACRRRSVPLRRSPSVFFVRPIVISRTLSKIHPYGTLYKLAPLILLPRSDPSNSGEVFWFQILKNRSDININVKNCCFITMCKAHSKVTHIKQQKYFHHLKRPGYRLIQSSYYIHGPLGDENIFAVLYVSLCYGPYTLL